ncbi:WD40 repeat protein [Kribbella voronezhensis]|uniref:WD40 repeat protein n=1 Tax=Kribbella voronezhensis TaxID=2512212 RepID=A0A4V3FJU9_9ACTN|nr:Hsp70 family protein [Kribbella voronezhensis]TDU87693.1 WD40 repeat protein [Kribbella voronezhensis]
MGYRLGVDLGTTFTAAAMRNGGPPSMLGLGNRALQIPSVLYLQEDGQFLVGEAAERRGATDPSRVVREFKRRIGDPIPLMVAGTPFSAQALSARLLSSVVATATERRGAPPDEIVLTYPANWGAYKRELVDQVISLADVGPTVTCPEPQAAAIQYAAQARLQPGDRVAVYDLGGGTFDVCVLEKTGNGFTILGNPEGIEQLGGVDFDEAVFQHVVGALGPAMEQLDLDTPEGRTALTRLRRDCVEAKEALSVDVDTMIPVTLPGRSTSVRLTRAELETLIAPALEQTVEATGRALRAAGTTSDQLTAIVLVGGSSRIPLVSHLLQSRFSTPTALDTHPKHDIALGAVQYTDTEATAPLSAVGATASLPAVGAGGSQAAGGAAGTGTASRVLPKPTRTPISSETRRRIAIAAGGVALLAVGVFVAIQLTSGDSNNQATQNPPATTPTSVVTSAPTSVTPSVTAPTLKALPLAGIPVSESELVIPLQNGDGQSLYLADAGNPGKSVKLSRFAGNAAAGVDSGPVLSPDRKSMIFTRSTPPAKPALWVSGADGSGARPLFTKVPAQCADGITRPAWNTKVPTQLVVACLAGKTSGLYLVDTDGKVLKQLFTASGQGVGVSDPAISPDGNRVAFQAQRVRPVPGSPVGTGVFTVPLDGTQKARQVTTGADADPAWSPVLPGVIAYRHFLAEGSWAIFLTNVDGSPVACNRALISNPIGGGKLCQFTDGSTLDQDPTWSPHGDQLAFRRGPVTSARIYVASLDGRQAPHPIWTTDVGNQSASSWTAR